MMAPSHFWSGLRPMTPDSTPIVGATPIPNLFLNAGHGTLGWTMACGSGRLIASLIGGEAPPIDPEGLGLDRYRSEKHTSELQSLMRHSYAVFCLKKKKHNTLQTRQQHLTNTPI